LPPACCLSREDGPALVLRSGAFMAVNSILPRVRGRVAQAAELSAFRGPDQPLEEAFAEIGHEGSAGAKYRRVLAPSPSLPGSAMRADRVVVRDELNVLFVGTRFLVQAKNFWPQSGAASSSGRDRGVSPGQPDPAFSAPQFLDVPVREHFQARSGTAAEEWSRQASRKARRANGGNHASPAGLFGTMRLAICSGITCVSFEVRVKGHSTSAGLGAKGGKRPEGHSWRATSRERNLALAVVLTIWQAQGAGDVEPWNGSCAPCARKQHAV